MTHSIGFSRAVICDQRPIFKFLLKSWNYGYITATVRVWWKISKKLENGLWPPFCFFKTAHRINVHNHCKLLFAKIRNIETLLQKNANAVNGKGSKRQTNNQNTAAKITHKLSPKLMKLYWKFQKSTYHRICYRGPKVNSDPRGSTHIHTHILQKLFSQVTSYNS